MSSTTTRQPQSNTLQRKSTSTGTLVSCISPITSSMAAPVHWPSVVCVGSYSYLAPTPMELDDNDVFNPSGAAYGSGCDNQVGNNISLDPGFKDAGAGDFHLTSGSRAIDAGDNSALTLLSSYNITVPTDFDGNPRALNPTANPLSIVDMGAFEYAV